MSDSLLLPNGRVVRYTFRERLMHWLAGLSYLYLLLTGSPSGPPGCSGSPCCSGGPTIARELHPWFGLIFTVAVLWMSGVWGSQMRLTDRDREWFRAVRHYVRNEDDQVPDEDRFNGGQKVSTGASWSAESCCSSPGWSSGSRTGFPGACASCG